MDWGGWSEEQRRDWLLREIEDDARAYVSYEAAAKKEQERLGDPVDNNALYSKGFSAGRIDAFVRVAKTLEGMDLALLRERVGQLTDPDTLTTFGEEDPA